MDSLCDGTSVVPLIDGFLHDYYSSNVIKYRKLIWVNFWVITKLIKKRNDMIYLFLLTWHDIYIACHSHSFALYSANIVCKKVISKNKYDLLEQN